MNETPATHRSAQAPPASISKWALLRDVAVRASVPIHQAHSCTRGAPSRHLSPPAPPLANLSDARCHVRRAGDPRGEDRPYLQHSATAARETCAEVGWNSRPKALGQRPIVCQIAASPHRTSPPNGRSTLTARSEDRRRIRPPTRTPPLPLLPRYEPGPCRRRAYRVSSPLPSRDRFSYRGRRGHGR